MNVFVQKYSNVLCSYDSRLLYRTIIHFAKFNMQRGRELLPVQEHENSNIHVIIPLYSGMNQWTYSNVALNEYILEN